MPELKQSWPHKTTVCSLVIVALNVFIIKGHYIVTRVHNFSSCILKTQEFINCKLSATVTS